MDSIIGAYWIKKICKLIFYILLLLNAFLCAVVAFVFAMPLLAVALLPVMAAVSYITSVKIIGYSMLALEKLRGFIVFLARKYFKKPAFLNIKEQYREAIDECNELARYITQLKRKCYSNAVLLESKDKSKSIEMLQDDLLDTLTLEQRYFCNASLYKLASKCRIEYLCKCFKKGINEKNLKDLEMLYVDLNTLIEARRIWIDKAHKILSSAKQSAPYIIREFGEVELAENLGINIVGIIKYHKFLFVHYESEKHTWEFEIEMIPETLEELIDYMATEIEHKGKISQPGPVMSCDLMSSIKERDNNTCQRCGACANDDKNLILSLEWDDPTVRAESIDKIQTVCRRCKSM